MCVHVSRADEGVIIRVTGSLDQEAAILLRRALFDLIVDQANAQLVLDLCGVTDMSEAALRVVEDAKQWTKQSNARIGICRQSARDRDAGASRETRGHDRYRGWERRR